MHVFSRLIIQAEFLTSDNLISVRRQVVTDAVDAFMNLPEWKDVRRIENAYKTIDADADSLYTDVKQFLYSKTLENDNANKIFGRTRGVLNQVINYITEETIVLIRKIPFSRYLFFIRVKRWTRASLVDGA